MIVNSGAGKVYHLLLLVVFIVALIGGCTGDPEKINPARVVVTLVDSPAEYEAVNVDIKEISLKTNGTEENNGWIKLENFTPGIYNILEFTGGHELKLADMEFPSGEISQIRLLLGSENSVCINKYDSKLSVPSGMESGLKINVNHNISPGITYYFKLDFDASRSVVKLGNTGPYILKPVIKMITEAESGAISGEVHPAELNVLINVVNKNTIVASSYAPENSSNFLVPGIDPGVYTIIFETNDGSYQHSIYDVKIDKGIVTKMGKINLED